jgi:Xaa-Pro dipeptidase
MFLLILKMILVDSDSGLSMSFKETYLVTENGNERLGQQMSNLVVL